MFALVREHAYELLRFARRFSLCEDDAHDAYQRALEILVRQLRTGRPPDNTLSWLRTVLRHEASQVREERERRMCREEHDVDEQMSGTVDDPAERVERFERLTQTAEALRRLKPQEVTALVLRAEGLSYQEICERTSWTYTRCNRAVTEGRRALRERLRAIESGEECERWLPLLSMLADGEASSRELAELRPHLRACPSCRATLRGFHEAPRQVRALVPAALLPVALAGAEAGGAARQLETVVHWVLERATMSAMRLQGAIDALPGGTKVAAVAASTVAVAGGGAAIERAATAGGGEHAARAAQVAAAEVRPVAVAPAVATPFAPAPSSGSAGVSDPAGGAGGVLPSASAAGSALQPEPESEFSLEPLAAGPSSAAAADPSASASAPRRHAERERPTATVSTASRASSPAPPEPAAVAADPPPRSTPPAPATWSTAPGGEFGGFESPSQPKGHTP